MRPTLLLCLLSACATAPLERGSPVAPAPALRPQQGPRVGPIPPGPHHQEATPRSPNRRVLQPQATPGLWKADEPRASAGVSEAWLLGTLLPPLEGVPDGEAFALFCAAEMGRDVTRLPPELMRAVKQADLSTGFRQQPCLSLQLYRLCAQRHLLGRVDVGGLDVKRAIAHADRLAAARCEGAYTDAVRAVLEAARALRVQ